MKEMKTYFVKYKDRGGYGCGEEIQASSEDQAVKVVQMELIREGDYMTELRDVRELKEDEDDGQWSIKGGPVLDQEDQDTLNDAMLNMVNENGMTLKQVWDKEIEEEKENAK